MNWKLIRPAAVAAGLFIVALGQQALAWNGTGHETIAYLAWQNLTPAAKQGVTEALRAHPHYTELFLHETAPAGEQRDLEAFMVAATWPDVVRTPNTPRSKYHRPTWHYADFPFAANGFAGKTEEPVTTWTPGTEPTNAIQAFFKNRADAGNGALTGAERGVAVCWIEHLVADVHQPLHATAMFSPEHPTGDRGGNDWTVTAWEKPINLHSLWDQLLGTNESFTSVQTLADRIAKKYGRRDLAGPLGDKEFVGWMKESYTACVKYVYLDGKLKAIDTKTWQGNKSQEVPMVPPGYMAEAMTLGERQAALAGFRLADVLNGVFEKPTASAPAATAPK